MTAPELPTPGTPEWHALEADEHLAAADRFAAAALAGDVLASSNMTARLLAAEAHAQLGALKLGLQQGQLLDALHRDLSELADRARAEPYNR